MTDVILATSSVAFEQRVRRAMGTEFQGTIGRWESDLLYTDALSAVKEMAIDSPQAVIVGPKVAADLALDIASAFDQEHPEVEVLVVAETVPGLFELALRSGVREILDPTCSDDDINVALTKVMEISARRRHNLATDTSYVAATSGKVVTIVSPKGGAGKTCLSTNLAVTLAEGGAGKVALVDLDLQFGDVGSALGLDPEHTIAELATAPGGVNPTTLKVFMTQYTNELHVLCAPLSPAEGEEIPEQVVQKTIRLLAQNFDYVIVDTSAGLTEATLAAIDQSTDLMFLCDMSVSALKGLKKVIEAVDMLGIEDVDRHFVLNRADSNVGIDPNDAAALVGMQVDVEVPSSRSITVAMNRGVPVNQEAPRTPVARSFEKAAELFGVEYEDRKKGFLRRQR